MVPERARETGAAFALCNLVGGQDELVFDGHSVVVAAEGETLARAAQFAEELLSATSRSSGPSRRGRSPTGLQRREPGARLLADSSVPSRRRKPSSRRSRSRWMPTPRCTRR